MKRFRRLSYANVTATVALIVALAGGAYAFALGANTVRSRQIAPDAAKGHDVEESTFKPVPTAKGLKHPHFGRISTLRLFDGIGIGMVMGRMNAVGNNATLYVNPSGEDTPTLTESEHLMGTYLSGSEAQDLKVQLLSGTMPAGTSRTFTLRAGNTSAGMSDTDLTCTMDFGDSSCSFEGVIPLSQLQDMLSIKIETTGAPGVQTILFGYTFTTTAGT